MSKAKIRGRHRDMNQLRKQGLVRLRLDLDDNTIKLINTRMIELNESRDEVIINILKEIIKNNS